MPKGSEEKRARGLFGLPAKNRFERKTGKRETVRERRIEKAKAKKPFDVRVRQTIAPVNPKSRLHARETIRTAKAAIKKAEKFLSGKKPAKKKK